mgnify:FL=1|jgi:hypothetical protein
MTLPAVGICCGGFLKSKIGTSLVYCGMCDTEFQLVRVEKRLERWR